MSRNLDPALNAPATSPTQSAEERAIAQRAADGELFEQLQADGFKGPRFDMLQDRLWLYGWRVMRAWMRDGTIVQRCRERRIYFAAPYTEVEEMMRRDDVRQDIAIDCLSGAIPLFMSDCLKQWKPDGGRSLNTYFLHLALSFYRDSYRKWASGHRQRMREVLGPQPRRAYFEDWDEWIPVVEPTFEEQTVLQETLGTILEGASMEERAVCKAMLDTDATQEEIAQKLGTTRKSVERRLSRVRQRARKLAAAGTIVTPSVSSAVTR
uniref:Sigma-70 family RNA polymerase sigma factor n=1 Tax=Streptomyces sp. NBC_00148 TaxID=2903626 RepID=A0AAU1M5A0_9ACTN